jgi:hypothetical protein
VPDGAGGRDADHDRPFQDSARLLMGDCWVVLAAAEPTAMQFFAALLASAVDGHSLH